jgi:hypothetical protein
MKTFTVAGYSILKGVKKMRFANDLVDRVKVLQRNGHTDIELQELPRAMTKDEIRVYLGEAVAAPAAPVAEAAVEETVAEAAVEETVAEAAVEETVAETPRITYATFEEALAAVPKSEKGRFLSRAAREERAQALFEPAPL